KLRTTGRILTLALFGSDTEKDKKTKKSFKKSKFYQNLLQRRNQAWKRLVLKPGIQIWRIVKFQVIQWPEKDHGKFFDGDSYIILNTYEKEETEHFLYDVHFWIGKYSTSDEYGTAAYKTVELDTYLDDIPIQYREVQGHESKLFRSYFDTITYLHGGAESGFNHVKEDEYKPRLFHFHGDKYGVSVKETKLYSKYVGNTDKNHRVYLSIVVSLSKYGPSECAAKYTFKLIISSYSYEMLNFLRQTQLTRRCQADSSTQIFNVPEEESFLVFVRAVKTLLKFYTCYTVLYRPDFTKRASGPEIMKFNDANALIDINNDFKGQNISMKDDDETVHFIKFGGVAIKAHLHIQAVETNSMIRQKYKGHFYHVYLLKPWPFLLLFSYLRVLNSDPNFEYAF
ncbi:gelsolin, partial [Mytilus galloprovincialis]